jgi:hypothetical protein
VTWPIKINPIEAPASSKIVSAVRNSRGNQEAAKAARIGTSISAARKAAAVIRASTAHKVRATGKAAAVRNAVTARQGMAPKRAVGRKVASKAAVTAAVGSVRSMGAMAEKPHKAEVTAEAMGRKAAVTTHKVGTADHRIMASRRATVRKAADRRDTVLKAVIAAKLLRAGMAELKAATPKGAMRHPAHKVDRASKGMASKAVTAAKAHRLGTDRRETSRQGKADTDRKVGTAPKIGMGPKVAMALKVALALKPVRVRRAGKLAAGARRAGTHHRRASPEVTADAVANNQDMAGTAAKAAAMDPRRATAHTGATVLKGAKRRAVAGAGTRAVGVRLD